MFQSLRLELGVNEVSLKLPSKASPLALITQVLNVQTLHAEGHPMLTQCSPVAGTIDQIQARVHSQKAKKPMEWLQILFSADYCAMGYEYLIRFRAEWKSAECSGSCTNGMEV